VPPAAQQSVEAVEKVPERISGRDAEKSDLTECATINDLMLRKGQVTPENGLLTRQKDFSYRLVGRNKVMVEVCCELKSALRDPSRCANVNMGVNDVA
jgi:hypothetical protein